MLRMLWATRTGSSRTSPFEGTCLGIVARQSQPRISRLGQTSDNHQTVCTRWQSSVTIEIVTKQEGINMSRSYRISVKESVRRVVRAEDHVRSQLEMLDILPPAQMADLLAAELIRQGFERDGDTVVRTDGDRKVTVDLKSGTVTVQSTSEQEVEVSGERAAASYDRSGAHAKATREKLQEGLVKDLEKDISQHEKALQKQVTDKLEGQLADLRKELDQAANRATAEALKQKAAQIGQIKELTEDPESGSLTIVVEV